MKNKLILDDCPYGNKGEICLAYMKIIYRQEADCSERCDEVPDQDLIIETRNGGGGHFLNIQTGSNGWSIDRNEDISEYIKDFNERLTINATDRNVN